MIKTTEELKREMFEHLEILKEYSKRPILCMHLENALEAYLEALRQEHDELRNKLQAFEFANKSAGDLLRDALATVKRQREFIRTLYTSRKARKAKRATRIQSSAENVASEICGALPDSYEQSCQHSWIKMVDYTAGTLTEQCIFCLSIREE